ncbi:MAG: C1 family peptidase [Mesorhizobium sp.]|nr:C1 family peptidase [Mesorhizobium sp.]MCO5160640.1 C1 family peptidase [Mesorhizobium sp.]
MNDAIRRVIDAQVDLPDARDLMFRPSLAGVRPLLDPRHEKGWWSQRRVRDQGQDPSCTGHAVAAAIDHLLAIDRISNGVSDGFEPSLDRLAAPYASAIMLYGNARLHDEWNGEGYSGSSLRGAIKGFRHNGVCSIEHSTDLLEKYRRQADKKSWAWHMNADIAESARKVLLGAYYRVRPLLIDMHCALNEAELCVCTARIHDGWFEPAKGSIQFDSTTPSDRGYHAFLVVGYTKTGFIVQNSWGPDWGDRGCAVWSYQDWARNVADAWVMRLAAPFDGIGRYCVAPQGVSAIAASQEEGYSPTGPIRIDVLGHLLPIVQGRLERHGTYQHDPATIEESIDIIRRRQSDALQKKTGQRFVSDQLSDRQLSARPGTDFKYRHVLIQVLAVGRSEDEAARFVRGTRAVYKENGIYPIYFLWECELFEELRRQIENHIADLRERTTAVGRDRDSLVARLLEIEAGGLPARLLREIERSFRRFFYFPEADAARKDAGRPRDKAGKAVQQTLRRANGVREMLLLFSKLSGRHRAGSISYHLAAHDLGARFVAELLDGRFAMRGPGCPVFSTLHLIAPLLEKDAFLTHVAPFIRRQGEGTPHRRAARDVPVVEKAWLWHLEQDAARRDIFNPDYPGDWPGLWSRILGGVISREAEETAEEQGGAAQFVDLYFDKETQMSLTRTLAVERFAKEAVSEAGDCDLVRKPIAGGDDDPEPTHFGLDGRVSLLNEMLETILGKGAIVRSFTSQDVEAAR